MGPMESFSVRGAEASWVVSMVRFLRIEGEGECTRRGGWVGVLGWGLG